MHSVRLHTGLKILSFLLPLLGKKGKEEEEGEEEKEWEEKKKNKKKEKNSRKIIYKKSQYRLKPYKG